MKTEIIPISSTDSVGHGIIKPDTYGTKPAAAIIFVHGNAGVGNGSQAGVQMVLDSQVPSNLKDAVDKYNIVVLFPQYSNSTDISCLDRMVQKARALPGVDVSRVYFMCFSRGGELVTRFMAASASRAALIAGCVNIGALNTIDTAAEAQYIVSEKVPMVFFHSSNDTQAPVNNTKTAVTTINAAGPVIPAKAVYYNSNQHDIANEVCSVEIFPFRGTETVNNIYEWMLLNSNDKPIGIPEAGGVVMPVPVVEDFITSVPKIILDGSRSRNISRDKCRWEKVSVPAGVKMWDVNTCNWRDCELTLPAEGKYVFRFIAVDDKGQSAFKDITVTYVKGGTIPPPDPVKKTVKSINHIGYWLTFTDDTKAQAVSVVQDVATSKTTYKISETEEYTI